MSSSLSSQFEKAIKVMDITPSFKNKEINTAILEMQSVISESMKKYPSQDSFNRNISLDDELADLSLVLLSSADSFGDFNEEVEIRSILQMIWTTEEDEEDE